MSEGCQNPSCNSCGQPHPNCRCYADGGEVMFDDLKEDPIAASTNSAESSFDSLVDDSEKYSSFGQQAITGLEGAAQGVAGPLAPAVERLFGVKAEDIRARQEQNPIAHGIGQAAGITGSIALGTGLGSTALKAGEVLQGITRASGLVGTAVKTAAEMAALQASQEAVKMITEDPGQSLQVAATNIGLAGLLGAASGPVFSKIGQAWTKAGEGSEQFLNDFVDRFKSRVGMDSYLPEAVDTKGAKLADALFSHGAKKFSGEALGAGAGAILGHATGIPGAGTVGAILGEHALAPAFETALSAIAKPLMENGISEAGVQAAHDFAKAVLKGNKLIKSAAEGILKVGGTSAISNLEPSAEDTEKLSEQLKVLSSSPEAMLDLSGNLGHYLPSHSAALGEMAAKTVQYLNAQRPKDSSGLPFDTVNKPTPTQNADWQRTLQIAQQPLMAMKLLDDGRLNHKDLQTLGTVYPAAYAKMREQLSFALIKAKQLGQPVPYAKRSALALFLGQPLDSTMTPQGIQFIQSAFAKASPPAPTGSPKKGNTQKLDKIAEQTATADQQREKAAQEA
jgi:hypothetical protein